jgi:hypothetical protein
MYHGEFGAELRAVDTKDDGPVEPDTYSFGGEIFTVPSALSALPRMRYAHACVRLDQAAERVQALVADARRLEAAGGADDDVAAAWETTARADNEALRDWHAAVWEYVRDVIDPTEWDRFEATAAAVGAGRDDLVRLANTVMAVVSGRPQRRSSGSQGGPSSTGGGSTDASDSTGTPAERQRAAVAALMTPLDDIVSGT